MYTETNLQRESRQKAFTYHPPGGDQPERYQRIRSECNKLSELLNTLCPPCWELIQAHSKLEEVAMWANAAIARNENRTTAPKPAEPDSRTMG